MSNYAILKKNNGTFDCYLQYQDGHEVWPAKSMAEAYQKLISGAWAYNGIRINRKMIEVTEQIPVPNILQNLDASVLFQEILSGKKVVLDFNDFRLVSNLLPEEVELIYNIREGKVRCIDASGVADEDGEFIRQLKQLQVDGEDTKIQNEFAKSLDDPEGCCKGCQSGPEKFRKAMKSFDGVRRTGDELG